MALKDLLRRKEPLLAIDIGSSSLKVIEFDFVDGLPTVVNVGYTEFDTPVFAGFTLSKHEKVAETLKKLIESNSISDRRVAIALPSSGVFNKRIKIPRIAMRDLESNVKFEAGRYLPDKIEALKLDYHILGEVGAHYDILLVAAKNELVDSFVNTLNMIGLQVSVIDVEAYAVQNCFELAHLDLIEQPNLIAHVGSRGATLNLCCAGDSLVTDNLSIGGKSFTDAIVTATGLAFEEAEALKRKPEELRANEQAWTAINKKMDDFSVQLLRQINLMKGAAGLTGPIANVILAGGGSRLPELSRIIKDHTGVDTQYLATSRALHISDNIDRLYIEQLESFLAVCAGLTLRQPGDKSMV